MRKFYWYATVFVRKHGLKLLGSLLLGIGIFSLLVPMTANRLKLFNRQYVGLIGEYTLATLPKEITNQLSVGLTQIDDSGKPQAAAAARWTLEQDGKAYRFTLLPNLRWEDGTTLQPLDIEYPLKDVEVLTTPNDILFKLPAPYAPFPSRVALPILKTSVIKRWWGAKLPSVMGLGSARISDMVLNGQRLKELTLESTEGSRVYRFYTTEDDAILAFKQGKVDVLPDMVREFDVAQWPTVSAQRRPDYWTYAAVFFNLRNPQLTKNIRQGLAYAIDKRQDELRATGPISPLSWSYLPGGKTYDKDWEKAVERWESELPPQPLALELTTTSVFQQQADVLAQQWQEFGQFAVRHCSSNPAIKQKEPCANLAIKVAVKIQNFPDTANFQLLLINNETDKDPDQYASWHSSQPTNFTGYKNTRIDSLLEKGRQALEQSERKEIYQEFQQYLLDDPPAIFLEYRQHYELQRKSIWQRLSEGNLTG